MGGAAPRLRLTLADYNQSVLELATIPNLFLTCYTSLHPSTTLTEVDITPQIVSTVLNDMISHGISASAISGAWSSEFSALLESIAHWDSQTETLVLASETIYSPTTLHAFTMTVLDILNNAEKAGGRARALIAVKRVYFGLGGGIDEFLMVLKQLGGNAEVVWETEGVGVGRVILEVTNSNPR